MAGTMAVANKQGFAPNGKYTPKELTFIERSRRMLMIRHQMEDPTIANVIAKKTGWSEGSVEYQITKMEKNGAGKNPHNKPHEYIVNGI